MTGNRLLERFPAEDRARLEPAGRRVTLTAGDIVCDPGRPVTHAVFPLTGLLSAVIPFRTGESAEATTIGNEGVVGLAGLIDDDASPYRVVQQVSGEAFLVPVADLRAAVRESEPLRNVLARYVITLVQQHAQNAACNLHHRVEARMARWLLSAADRVGRDAFGVTQEILSSLLGVSRQSVSTTAGQLQQAGLIAYSRGSLRITDRGRLEQASCECYRAAKDAYERLMRSSAA